MPPKSSSARPLTVVAVVGALLLSLAGCTQPSEPASSPSASIPPGAAPASPAPGRTVEAAMPDQVGVLRGARIAVVVPDDGPATRVLRDALRAFATESGLIVDEFDGAGDEASVDAAFGEALATQPHLVVGLGEKAVDVFAYNSAQFLDQDFLLVGAQVAEPTSNVVSVVWDGATSRGSGAPADGDVEESAVTEDRAAEAVAVGVTTMMSGQTGIVLHLAD